jgi:hypothetical protein
VTIIGTNFAETPVVRFGPMSVGEFSSKSETEISLKTPAQVTDGPMLVTVGGDAQQDAYGAFTFVARDAMSTGLAAFWFGYMAVMLVIGIYVLAAIWPGDPTMDADGNEVAASAEVSLFGVQWEPATDVRLLFVAGAAGVLGATAYGLIALARWLGRKRDDEAWSGYYFARPFAGFALAAVIYWVARGGLVVLTTDGGDGSTVDINVNSVAALGGLAGLMTMNSMQILDQIFKSVFRFGEASAQRLDEEPAPTPPATGDGS